MRAGRRGARRGLNEQAGLLGVSGASADMRAVQEAADQGAERAQLAVAMFVHRLSRDASARWPPSWVGWTPGLHRRHRRAQLADSGRGFVPDCASRPRARRGANDQAKADAELTTATSTARVLVVAAREDLTILSEVKRLLS